jgi:hypothetical protein
MAVNECCYGGEGGKRERKLLEGWVTWQRVNGKVEMNSVVDWVCDDWIL